MELSELSKSFKKAIIIDMTEKNVWVIKDGKVKVYPEKYYNQLIKLINLDFGEK